MKIFWNEFFKCISLYYIFVVFVILSEVLSNLFSNSTYVVDISLIIIFMLSMMDENNQVSYFGVFLFGLITDVLTLLPMGTSSISLLIAYRLATQIRKYFNGGRSFLIFFRDFLFFINIYYFIKWFILYSVFNTSCSLSKYTISLLANCVYYIIFYSIYNKIKA